MKTAGNWDGGADTHAQSGTPARPGPAAATGEQRTGPSLSASSGTWGELNGPWGLPCHTLEPCLRLRKMGDSRCPGTRTGGSNSSGKALLPTDPGAGQWTGWSEERRAGVPKRAGGPVRTRLLGAALLSRAPLSCPFLPQAPTLCCTPRQAPCLCLGPTASHPPREKSQVLSSRGLFRLSPLCPTPGPQHTNTLSVYHRLSPSPPKLPADLRPGHTQPSREAAMLTKHCINSVDLIPDCLHPYKYLPTGSSRMKDR